jgi:hypothetical protein
LASCQIGSSHSVKHTQFTWQNKNEKKKTEASALLVGIMLSHVIHFFFVAVFGDISLHKLFCLRILQHEYISKMILKKSKPNRHIRD